MSTPTIREICVRFLEEIEQRETQLQNREEALQFYREIEAVSTKLSNIVMKHMIEKTPGT